MSELRCCKASRSGSNTTQNDERLGFTLIELLVVIAIIGLLIVLYCRRFEPRARPPAGSSA